MITVHKTDGTSFEVKHSLKLGWMQKQVGGYIQALIGRDGSTLIMDEEGKLKAKPVNEFGTGWFIKHFGFGDIVVGDVIHITLPDKLE